MGLIAATLSSVGSVFADQWKEFFYCDAIDDNTLAVRAQKRTNGKGSNKGNDNVISNGSGIVVAEGQCALIVDQGRVVEICAQAGEYTYDMSTEPSLFYGSLGKNILETFKAIGKRISYGGVVAKDQRIYYINTKPIHDNRFGTQRPIPFHMEDKSINLSLDISLQCNGAYLLQIVDPILFYTNVCANAAGDYLKMTLDKTLLPDFLTALRPALMKVSPLCKHYADIGNHTLELCQALNDHLSPKWGQQFGLKIIDVYFNVLNATEEDEKNIKRIQLNATNRDASMAAATLVSAQAEAMTSAAKNTSGAMAGFMGMNMVQNAGGINAMNLFQMAQQNQAAASAAPAAPAANSWTCSCGTVNQGKFCTECASPKPAAPAANGWTCVCGAVNQGKFCQECGQRKPAGAPIYRCDKCGWCPPDPAAAPKFCPECGDVFDSNDMQS